MFSSCPLLDHMPGFGLCLANFPPFSPGLSHPGFPPFQTKELRGHDPLCWASYLLGASAELVQRPSMALPGTTQDVGGRASKQNMYPHLLIQGTQPPSLPQCFKAQPRGLSSRSASLATPLRSPASISLWFYSVPGHYLSEFQS